MRYLVLKARSIGITTWGLALLGNFYQQLDEESMPWWMWAAVQKERGNMAIPQKDINNWFTYHAPTPEQLVAYNDIRLSAKIFAETVNKHVPDSADKTAAIRKIREATMAANAAVACNWPENEGTEKQEPAAAA